MQGFPPAALVRMLQKKRQSLRNMQHKLTSLLFPGYRHRVLGLLLLAPDEALHGREIARRTSLPPGTVARELNRLVEAGLLKREKRGNQVLYSADRTSIIFEELAGILRKTSGVSGLIAKALSPYAARIDTAFIYGSFARGTATANSDIDVLIVGEVDFGSVFDTLHPLQKELGREINPKVFSTREWRTRLEALDPFIMEVMEKPRIHLAGDKDESE